MEIVRDIDWNGHMPKRRPRLVCCRYLEQLGNRCTAEVCDPEGEILLCERHMALALALLTRCVA
jgi:hypothetical protein